MRSCTVSRDWVLRLIRLGLAMVFAFAAVPKIVNPAAFAEAVYRYHLLPDWAINLVAIYLPWLELVCAVALILLPGLRRGAFALIGGMLFVFTGAMAVNLYRGIDIACGCFSVTRGDSLTGWNIARNLGLLLITAAGWALERTRLSSISSPAPHQSG